MFVKLTSGPLQIGTLTSAPFILFCLS